MNETSKHIVVLGAGFGGLTFCKSLRHPAARMTLVDQQNHHLFQPLLYQMATAGLSAPDIAQPARSILSNRPNVTVLLDRVTGFDLNQRRVFLAEHELEFDYLVLALGGVTSYFGHPEWEAVAPGLKTLDDALRIRAQVLLAFERAENTRDRALHDRLLTIVVVGGGPTGVELAGAFAELARKVLRRDFRRIDPGEARVILLEAGDRLLAHLPPGLSENARRQLERLGVEVRLRSRVKHMKRGHIQLESGEMLEAENIIWGAGIEANPLTRQLGVELDRAGRVKVNPDLSVPGHPTVFAIGDLAHVPDKSGQPVPGVSPAAMQMARHVARVIEREMGNRPAAARPAFQYWDKGTMATIGRSAAVAKIGPVHITGWPAWLAWLFVHLIFLIGFRNKLSVMLHWVYSYCTYRRGARIIFGQSGAEVPGRDLASQTRPVELRPALAMTATPPEPDMAVSQSGQMAAARLMESNMLARSPTHSVNASTEPARPHRTAESEPAVIKTV